jgi:glutamine---fructose-6-phosphate transaminase (isomerizing)
MTATGEEISSQPDTWGTAFGRVAELKDVLVVPGERVLAIGCGTSAFVAQSFARLREGAGFGETDAAYASELPVDRQYDRVVAFSRSGTTTEILTALRDLPSATRKVVVTAVAGSAVGELADDRVVFEFADEASVVQTRFPTSVLVAARAALGLPYERIVEDGRSAVAAALPVDPSRFHHFVFLGTGWTVGLAHEAALKVREMAQCWSESYPAMDFRHGPVAAVTSGSLAVRAGAGWRGGYCGGGGRDRLQ